MTRVRRGPAVGHVLLAVAVTIGGGGVVIGWLVRSYATDGGGSMPALIWVSLLLACLAFGYAVGRTWAIAVAAVVVVGALLALDLAEVQGRPSATNPEPVGPLIFVVYLPVLLVPVWAGVRSRRWATALSRTRVNASGR